jgi:hypothetical protein
MTLFYNKQGFFFNINSLFPCSISTGMRVLGQVERVPVEFETNWIL